MKIRHSLINIWCKHGCWEGVGNLNKGVVEASLGIIAWVEVGRMGIW